MNEAVITIVCGTLLTLQQGYLAYRLKQQDNARDAARAEQAATAKEVKAEALSAAKAVEDKVDTAAEKVDAAAKKTDAALTEIHVIVNSRQSEMLERMQALEAKLGLAAGQEIPGPPTITEKTDGPDTTARAPRRTRKKSA